MWQRNNGQGEDNVLQNQFTAYLIRAIRWQKSSYLKKRAKRGEWEFLVDFGSTDAQTIGTASSPEQPILENLAQALGQISDRERFVFLARVLENGTDTPTPLPSPLWLVCPYYHRAAPKTLCYTLIFHRIP